MARPKIAIRPAATPTCSGGGMDWYIYSKPDGKPLTFAGHNPAAYVVFHQERPDSLLRGWRGAVGCSVVDSDNDAHPSRDTRERIQARVELLLVNEGYTILDRPEWTREVDESPEAWSLKSVVDGETHAGWEARVFHHPGTRTRRGGTPPHWRAEATLRTDGPDELELVDPTEHPSVQVAQGAAEQLLWDFLERCLAVLPLRAK